MNAVLQFPDAITQQRIAELKAKGLDADIAAIDLEMVKMKLQDPDEGKGWDPETCEQAELEYKRYLQLNRMHEDQPIVPTTTMDTMWHFHILDTKAYHRDCQETFGYYFHHYPYFGMRGKQDEENLKNAFFKTCELYEQAFGEDLLRNEMSGDCWHDCQGRCWHACSDDN